MVELNPGFDGKLAHGWFGQPGMQPVIENGKVVEIGLETGKVATIAPLRAFGSLRGVTLLGPGEHLSDLSPLRGMPIERLFSLSHYKITDVSPVAGPELRELLVTQSQVSDLSPLSGLKLRLLNLAMNPIRNIDALAGLPLETLGLDALETYVTDLSPLKGMPLRVLTLRTQKLLTDISPLAGMSFERLDLQDTGVKDIGPLRGSKITKLELDITPVEDVSPLAGMPLVSLGLGKTNVTDLSPLRGLKLEVLAIHECPRVKDTSPLESLPTLKLLWLDFDRDRDTSALRKMKSLETINGKPAAEFWKEVDEQQKNKPGIMPDGPVPPPAKAPFDAKQARAHQEAWAKHLGVPVEYTNSIGMKFVLIPPGEFMMGSTASEIEAALKDVGDRKHWHDCIKSEAPQHTVILTRPIYLGTNEVTQAEYERVMGANPSNFSPNGKDKEAVAGLDTARHPVEMVSWNDAADFCIKLSHNERHKPLYGKSGETFTTLNGTGYRLPTEAEWEFSCRAGTLTKYWTGDQDEDLVRAAWIGGNSGSRTHAVHELNLNPFGLADMHGNVWEWVQDGWDATYYSRLANKPAINPSSPFLPGTLRVIRGGVWYGPASFCRSSHRDADAASNRGAGFRVALTVDAVKLAATKKERYRQLFMHGPAFPQWVKDVQAMPADKQLEVVSKKLVELNLGK